MRVPKTAIVVSIIAAAVAYRPVARWGATPSAVRASWVEPLADRRGNPGRPTFGKDPKDVYSDWDAVLKANEQMRHLFQAAQTGQGKFGLFRRYGTVEGAPILTWLLVDDGRLTYVHDHTRDGGAAATAVDVHTPKAFKLGFMRDSIFVEGEPTQNDSQKIVLELEVQMYSHTYYSKVYFQ